ncbi:hypothetical protein L3X38_042837 [Prunus dulcis]|uniref:Uncharacterized protein n=1 Tax=Prunus dulcis TaxID=3755 RepID=A0AAD4UX13_PRUDU|nr:hypothetical protein L3X38_042837 [Prunus dulcis]
MGFKGGTWMGFVEEEAENKFREGCAANRGLTTAENWLEVAVPLFKFIATNTVTNTSIQGFIDILSPCITQSDNGLLLVAVSEQEVFNVINRIGALKAPVPDGL